MNRQNDFLNAGTYSNNQLTVLVLLRVVIGWHIFYEGFAKLLNPNWSSVGYLMDSHGWFAGIFKSIAGNPTLLKIADQVNIWALVIIGLLLIIGLLEKPASIAAIILIGLYFLSHPALIGVKYAAPGEGSYLLINKNVVEIFAVAVNLVFPNSRFIGIDRFFFNSKKH